MEHEEENWNWALGQIGGGGVGNRYIEAGSAVPTQFYVLISKWI